MSNIGSTSGQHGDNATLPQFSRKRSSPNSGSSKSEAPPTVSVAAVGSSSSKLRRVAHSSGEQNPENSDLPRQQNSQLPGTSETKSASGGSGRTGPSSGRSGHESVRSELKYLTDFFPDQNPSGRRLTRSQRQYSVPVSQTTDNIDSSAHTNSASQLVEQPRSTRDRPRTRKGRTSVAGRAATGTESSPRTANSSEQQPSTSSSARTRAHSSATGLCHSIARCESTANRVSPTFAQQGESSGCRSAPQLGVVIQDTANNTSSNTVVASNNATLATPVNSNVITATTGTEVSRATNGDVNAVESHSSSQFRNLQRSQAVHAASSFLGALVPRVQHLLGSAHAHPRVVVKSLSNRRRQL